MTNHRTTLGLPDTANADDIKAAYRKLAMKHHPDRGGNEETFKTIKQAYESLESTGFAAYVPPRQARPGPAQSGWTKPESPAGTWQTTSMDEILAAMRASRNGRPQPNPNYVQPNSEVIINVPLRDAARGFEWSLSRQKPNGFVEHLNVIIPPGLPDNHRGRYTLSDGSTQVIMMKIDSGDYRLRGLANTFGTIFEAGIIAGDVEIDISTDAIDLITGNWIEVEDFMGEKLTVRIPSGFDPNQRLKVAGKGYFGWNEEQGVPTKYRRDMYIKLRPIYNSPEKIDRAKILKLYNAVGGWDEDDKN